MLEEFLDKDEKILFQTKKQKKLYFKNYLSSIFMFIIVWVLLDAFFIYLMTIKDVSMKYWYLAIPVAGFNALSLLIMWSNFVRHTDGMSSHVYAITNKAVYSFNNHKGIDIKKILFKDITSLKKDEENNTFIVASATSLIEFKYIEDVNGYFNELSKHINKIEN